MFSSKVDLLLLPSCTRQRVSQDQNDRIPSQEHLRYETIFIDGFSLFPFPSTRNFRPHLLHILQYHVTVTIEGFYTSKQLFVVPAVD